jgi:hypothetical protein
LFLARRQNGGKTRGGPGHSELPLIVATGSAISVTAVVAVRAAIAAKFGLRFYGQIYVDHPQTAHLDLVPQVVLLKHLIDPSKSQQIFPYETSSTATVFVVALCSALSWDALLFSNRTRIFPESPELKLAQLAPQVPFQFEKALPWQSSRKMCLAKCRRALPSAASARAIFLHRDQFGKRKLL